MTNFPKGSTLGRKRRSGRVVECECVFGNINHSQVVQITGNYAIQLVDNRIEIGSVNPNALEEIKEIRACDMLVLQ